MAIVAGLNGAPHRVRSVGLDEVKRPKVRAVTFQDEYNQRLARTCPGRKVHDLGQSFTHSVDGFKRCEPLFVALQALKYAAG